MGVIYKPKGRALEYCDLACNLYRGCGNNCEYCYVPRIIRMSPNDFQNPTSRKDIIQRLAADAPKLRSQLAGVRTVLLCFSTDPYQPLDEELEITRCAIHILHTVGFGVTILTKGGQRAERDFDLMGSKDTHAVTLTLLDDCASLEWEPMAALPGNRIATLEKAHQLGMKTWVSLEPVLDPKAVYEIIAQTHTFVDQFKVGVLNYHPHAKTIDWMDFAIKVVGQLEHHNCDYYLKEDLRKWLPLAMRKPIRMGESWAKQLQ